MGDVNDWRETCTIETCGLQWSYWGYRPTLSANVAFAVLFGISTAAFLAQGLLGKRWAWFTFSMVAGCLLELIGYVGRILAHKKLYYEIVTLTIGPAFLAAGIYLCLSRIVITFGPENSRIKPLSYPRIFIPCDVLSLILQATGGGIASVNTHLNKDPKVGNNIMIAGLSVQVFTMFIFIVLSADFGLRTMRRISQLGADRALDSRHAKLRQSKMFKGFLIALALSTLCIFTRCVYRVAELSEGWKGHLINTEKYFIGLEGAVVVVAVLLLNAFHPAFCFRGALDARGETNARENGRKWYGRKRKDADIATEEVFETRPGK